MAVKLDEQMKEMGLVITPKDRQAVDKFCKTVLSFPEVIEQILHDFVPELNSRSVEDIRENYSYEVMSLDDDDGTPIPMLNTEHFAPYGNSVFFDILFLVKNKKNDDEQYALLINLEAQTDPYPGYSLVTRSLVYCAHLLIMQMDKALQEVGYKGLKKAYSIWVCINPPKKQQNTVTQYHVTENCLLGEVKAKKEEYDLMESLFVRLGEDAHVAEYPSMNMLDLSLFQARPEAERMAELEQRFPELAKQLRRKPEVSNLLDGFCKAAALRGHAEGIAEGEARGFFNGMLNSIKCMMQNKHTDLEETFNTLSIPQDDRPKYRAALAMA